MQVRYEVQGRTGGRSGGNYHELTMSTEKPGVWEMKVDLRTELGKY